MLCSVGWCFIQPGTQWPCVAMVACSYLPCVSRYMERRGIEVGQVELMLYVKPLQEKRCAGGHFLEVVLCECAFLEVVVCEWALLEVVVCEWALLEVVVCEWALSGSSGVSGLFWK